MPEFVSQLSSVGTFKPVFKITGTNIGMSMYSRSSKGTKFTLIIHFILYRNMVGIGCGLWVQFFPFFSPPS